MAVPARAIDGGARGILGRWALAFVLLVGFHVLAVGLLVVLGYAGTLALPRRPWLGATIMVVPFLWPVVQGVLVVRREVGADEWPVQAGDEPDLWAAVAAVASRMETAPPTRILLTPGTSAHVTEHARLLGLLAGDRELRLGVGLFSACRVDELQAVLAHELAHFVGGDSRVDAVISRTWGSIVTTVHRLDDAVASWIFVVYARLFARITAPILRREELRADAMAAAVVGPAVVARALVRVQRADLAFEELEGRLRVLARSGRYPANLYDGLRQVLADPHWRAGLDARARELPDEDAALATHPAMSDRLARVRDMVAAGASLTDRRPARSLLDRPDEHEERASALVAAHVATGDEPTRLDWPAATTALWLVGRGQGDGDLPVLGDGSSGGEALALLDVLERGGPVAVAALGVDLGQWPDEQRSLVARRVTDGDLYRVVGRVAIEHGYRVRLAWDRRDVFVDPAGTPAPVLEWVRTAVESPEVGIPALRGRLRGIIGPPGPTAASA